MPERSEEQGRIDYLIDQMFDVLPCATRAEIAEKLSRRTRTTVTEGTVGVLLTILRSNAEAYGWTVPHVKRSTNNEGDKRFFAALVEPEGEMYLDETPEARAFMKDGAKSTISHATTSLRNEQMALLICVGLTRSRNRKALLQEWAEDMAYMARKGRRLLEALQDDETVADVA